MPSVVDKLLNSQFVQLGLAALAFLIALWLVIVIARMLMGGRLRLPGGRTRQARLGIVDAFDLDRQRQLIIVRRDNTEHLIMIGGPNDLVIESEIVRVEARDNRRDKGFDFADGRQASAVSAPTIAARDNGAPVAPRPEEPLLPMPLPQAASQAASAPQGASFAPTLVPPAPPRIVPEAPIGGDAPRVTFPLPPRRPAPPPAERRGPPPLPERALRDDPFEAPPLQSEPPMAAPSQVASPPPVAPPQPLPLQGSPPQAAPGFAAVPPVTPSPSPLPPPAAPEVPVRPATLRPPPLPRPPPRIPPRPLKRVTPQAEPAAADGGSGSPPAPSFPRQPVAPAVPKAPTPPVAAPVPEPSSAPPSAPGDDLPGGSGLESLEEEMAKLLGR